MWKWHHEPLDRTDVEVKIRVRRDVGLKAEIGWFWNFRVILTRLWCSCWWYVFLCLASALSEFWLYDGGGAVGSQSKAT